MKFQLSIFLVIFTLIACSQNMNNTKTNNKIMNTNKDTKSDTLMIATFGAGCFWCVEAQFQLLLGVDTVISGYTGGNVPTPTYKEVCTGTTGHAEVCNIYYNPQVISYEELLQAFFVCHNPTTLNQQGNDHGTQYRSAIFYRTSDEKAQAEKAIKSLNENKLWSDPIVTEIAPIGIFYTAEAYHQNYYNQNNEQPYCAFVVKPKKEHFEQVFKTKLKYKQ
jgi:peptide-methionine (S)-S-oxide reductase